MLTFDRILVILVLAAIWAVFVLVSPTRKCTRCRGERVARSRWNNQVIGCPRCKGTGRHYRLGAVAAHRGWQSLRGAVRTTQDWQDRDTGPGDTGES